MPRAVMTSSIAPRNGFSQPSIVGPHDHGVPLRAAPWRGRPGGGNRGGLPRPPRSISALGVGRRRVRQRLRRELLGPDQLLLAILPLDEDRLDDAGPVRTEL